MRKKRSKEDKQTLEELNSAHRHSQAKSQKNSLENVEEKKNDIKARWCEGHVLLLLKVVYSSGHSKSTVDKLSESSF